MNTALGAIRQNGFVVADLDDAIRDWTDRLGVGPFFRIAEQPLVGFTHRGAPSEARIAVALAQSGGIQIELIQPLDEHPSAFTEYRRTSGAGLQHVAHWTQEFDQAIALLRARGLRLVQSGRSGSGGPDERFAYFEVPGSTAPIVEISETRGRKAALFAAVAAASEDWDGADPVRDMAELLR
jgi:hypothetical protein